LKGANGANGQHAPPPPIVPPTAKKPVAPAPTPVPPAAPRVEPAQPAIIVGLWDLAENWPDGLKEEISRSDIANANLPLPGAFVETGLRRGRITMTWKQIRLLAKPSSVPSPNDGLELELPLKLIAPLFFAAKKTGPTAKKAVNVSTDIPNLFFGFPQVAPESPAPQRLAPRPRPTAEAAAPAPAVPPPAPVSPANKAGSNTNFYVWGDDGETPQEAGLFAPPPVPQTDFTSRRAMPKDVVEKAVTFRGVAGALVTLPDGLRVASNVPVEFNADTLAAFIPQIFERMNQSARELRMGALNNVSFTVGNVPWRIFRVNSVYLAAFGRAGESLPAADLAALAGELDRKK
jgi:predicted regulator of Ras-like GTPase activity (Roadblock/LC7/MglB family)